MQQCQFCEKTLKGRSDKKFCDVQCRTAYHNSPSHATEKMMRAVNKRIRINRKILKKLCPAGKGTVRREELVQRGFSFQYFSSIYPTKQQIYFFCYDYGYSPIQTHSFPGYQDVQKVVIINKQEYMNKPFNPWTFKSPVPN